MADSPRLIRLSFILALTAFVGALLAAPAPSSSAERVIKRVDFGEHLLGSAGRTESISIDNRSSAPVQISPLTLGGGAPDLFAIQSDGCSGRTLAYHEECQFSVRFTPSRVPDPFRRTSIRTPVVFDPTRGALATVTFTRGSSPDRSIVALDARVLRPAALALGLNDHSYGFEAVPTGREAQPRLFHIGNMGDVPATVGQLSITGSGARHFELRQDTCSMQTLAPAPPCTYEVIFRPKRPGVHRASVVVVGADPATTTATITGTARPTVRGILRLLTRRWAPKLSRRRLKLAIKRGSLFLGSYSIPLASRIEASVLLRSRGRRDRRVAMTSDDVNAREPQAMRLSRAARAGRIMASVGARPRLVLRLELVEPTGERTVASRVVPMR
jgi:hypothetical protein